MLTPEVITDTIFDWIQSLDYEYMLLHSIVSYGLFYSKNMSWLNKKMGGLPYSVWKIGAILALIEVARIIPFIDPNMEHYTPALVQKCVSIFHSYIVIQVFVEDIVKLVKKWFELFRRLRGGG